EDMSANPPDLGLMEAVTLCSLFASTPPKLTNAELAGASGVEAGSALEDFAGAWAGLDATTLSFAFALAGVLTAVSGFFCDPAL
ncbi:hypothetical protein, partial [Pseudomonas viridiflava]|uniref:hypothetical protein n=1 Tax=Pseudomonas viridiflava TaxID=33069 RepID=UPI0013D69A9D